MEENIRNKRFYEKYTLENYYRDYFEQSEQFYTNYTSRFELGIATKEITNEKFNLLIVGLGFGRELDHFIKYFESSNISIIDFNPLFIENAKKIYNTERVKFFEIDLNTDNLPFLKNEFDFILCLNTLEYLNSFGYEKFFSESNIILKENGILIFRHLNKTFPFSFLDIKHQNNRHYNLPKLAFRSYAELMFVLKRDFYVVKEIPYNFQISFRLYKILYSNYLLKVGLAIEQVLKFILKPKYFKNIYIIAQKKSSTDDI